MCGCFQLRTTRPCLTVAIHVLEVKYCSLRPRSNTQLLILLPTSPCVQCIKSKRKVKTLGSSSHTQKRVAAFHHCDANIATSKYSLMTIHPRMPKRNRNCACTSKQVCFLQNSLFLHFSGSSMSSFIAKRILPI